MTAEHTQLIRGLGLIAAISINVANIIGTGVFLKARVMTCNVGTPRQSANRVGPRRSALDGRGTHVRGIAWDDATRGG